MDPPSEADQMTSDLLNQTDLPSQDVHPHTEKAAPAHTGMVCVMVHRHFCRGCGHFLQPGTALVIAAHVYFFFNTIHLFKYVT